MFVLLFTFIVFIGSPRPTEGNDIFSLCWCKTHPTKHERKRLRDGNMPDVWNCSRVFFSHYSSPLCQDKHGPLMQEKLPASTQRL